MLSDLTMEQWAISFAFVCCLAFICGFISDRIMGYAGFGATGNWLILLGGAYISLYSYNVVGYKIQWYPTMTVAVAAGGASILLIVMAIFKTIFEPE